MKASKSQGCVQGYPARAVSSLASVSWDPVPDIAVGTEMQLCALRPNAVSVFGRMDCTLRDLFRVPLDLVLCLPPFFCIPLDRPRSPRCLPFALPVSSTWFTPLLPGKLLLLLQG